MRTGFPSVTGTLVVLGIIVLPASAAPQLAKIAPQTLQSGAAATLVIDGTELMPNPRIILPVPVAAQTVKDGATATKVQIEVKLADNVPPGVYQLRMASDKGISNPVGVEIDAQPQQPFGPQVGKLPASLLGNLAGSTTLSTTLAGKKSQRLVIEVEARRIGSVVDPVVKLFDPQRVQIASTRPSTTLGGDARLLTTLPADGTYTIELHDLQYKAGSPNRFRLRVGDFHYADQAFPLAGPRGTKASFQLVGSLPDSVRVEADLTATPGGSKVRLPQTPGLFGSAPSILVSELPEVMESEPPPGKLQEVNIPAGINGRLGKPQEEDRYRLKVQPGMKLRFEVLGERAGSPLDGVLVLRNEAGAQLARVDDQPGTFDPGLEYSVPEGVNSLVAAVTDLQGRGGPNFLYRLAVTPAGLPDFNLMLLDDRPHVPRNGAALVRVRAVRAGYTGPIKLSLVGVPEGVAVSGAEIPPGATDTLLSFTAAEGTKLSGAVLEVIGESTEPNVSLRRLALLPETPLSRVHPWMRGELALAVIDTAPIGISWEIAEDKLPIGGRNSAKVTVARAGDVKGPIRLVLLSSQVVPRTKDGKMDDVNRAIRLEAATTIPPDQTTAEVKIVVPGDLPPLPYDLAIRAELLGADGKTVLATAVTPARRLTAGK